MIFNKIADSSFSVSKLGFGTMRLPIFDDDPSSINTVEAYEMLNFAIGSSRINYIDTAYPYHDGEGEKFLGKYFKDCDKRGNVQLATKMPLWEVNETKDFDRLFQEQLTRLKTDKIDYYLMHCLEKHSWPKMKKLGIIEWFERKKQEGLISHFGFSFHDDFDVFKQIIDDYNWEFCQIQYNFMGEDVQAGTKGLKYAKRKGVNIIVMEPLLGGVLVNYPPRIQKIWDDATKKSVKTPVELALRWLCNQPEISMILSGMSTLEQVRENMEIVSNNKKLTEYDLKLINDIRNEYNKIDSVPCTKCNYCIPCPHGVDIPRIFEMYNEGVTFGEKQVELNKNIYAIMNESRRADKCIECGICEEKCPQSIPIMQWLKKAEIQLTGKK